MTRTVLVAYATKHGSTEEVAQAVAAALGERGLHVEVRRADEVERVESYDAVVLGSALYMGRVHEGARTFLRRHRLALATLPVAIFGMGPKTMTDTDVASSLAQLERGLAKFPEVEPVSVAIFGGVVDPEKLHFPFNRMPATDARDWDAISAWAAELIPPLGGPSVAPASQPGSTQVVARTAC